MSRLGEYTLRKFSRDPTGEDYPVEHDERQGADPELKARLLTDSFGSLPGALKGARVLSAGCGNAVEPIALALLGAKQITGIDIRLDPEYALGVAEAAVPRASFAFLVVPVEQTPFENDSFDVVVSRAAYEHFSDPVGALREMARVVRPGGRIYLTSAVWAGPWGAHMTHFTRVPWVHYLFSEETIMAVRNDYRSDGAKRFHEVDGGLSKIKLRRFKQNVRELGLHLDRLEPVALKRLVPLTRIPGVGEFFMHAFMAELRVSSEASLRNA